MNKPRMGEMLRRMGKLSMIDVDEILVEQAVNARRFGEIAVSWGLCDPGDICEAWCVQFEAGKEVDLPIVGVDPLAAAALPECVATALNVIPLRFIGDQMIVAAGRELDSVEIAELVRAARRDVRLVSAPAHQIALAIERFYGEEIAAAA